jgi:hypothetical protein
LGQRQQLLGLLALVGLLLSCRALALFFGSLHCFGLLASRFGALLRLRLRCLYLPAQRY